MEGRGIGMRSSKGNVAVLYELGFKTIPFLHQCSGLVRLRCSFRWELFVHGAGNYCHSMAGLVSIFDSARATVSDQESALRVSLVSDRHLHSASDISMGSDHVQMPIHHCTRISTIESREYQARTDY
jgi:hypothetical protein